jgi:hypothetical protein
MMLRHSVPGFASSVAIMSDAKQMTADLMRRMVELANSNETLMDGTTKPVKRIIAEADVVFGIWPDATKPHGIDSYIIKGRHLLADGIASNITQRLRCTAIKCIELEQAVAAAEVFGSKLN